MKKENKLNKLILFIFGISTLLSIVFIIYLSKNNLELNLIYNDNAIFSASTSIIYNVFDDNILGQFVAIHFNMLFYSFIIAAIYYIISLLITKFVKMITNIAR